MINASNKSLTKAKLEKNDEFYTQYSDIENEISVYTEYNQDIFKDKIILLPCDDPEWSNFTKFFIKNFKRFEIKKLISTSYNIENKKGKIFILDKNKIVDKMDVNDLHFYYLNDNGDFRSEEIKKLRDESDIIITNPPFSLFRDFFNWIVEANKQFLIVGSLNAILYKDIFPLIKNNKIWLGSGFRAGNASFLHPLEKNCVCNKEMEVVKFGNAIWLTNIQYKRNIKPLILMTMEDNIKFSKHKKIKGFGYLKYINYDAIDIPFLDSIPSNYYGIMGVPMSFIFSYNPDQFEIIGTDTKEQSEKIGINPIGADWINRYKKVGGTGHYTANMRNLACIDFNGIPKTPYARILIRYK